MRAVGYHPRVAHHLVLDTLAVAGLDPVKIQRRAGHTTIETTMGYIREAESSLRPHSTGGLALD